MTELEIKKQIALFKEYDVTNYKVEDGEITIGGNLDLRGLTTVHKDFLKGTTIGGYLDLRGLATVHEDFLKCTTIGGYLDLEGLTTVDKDFLKGTTIGGSLDLRGLTTVDKDFLKGTTIGGWLDLLGLTTVGRRKCENNVNELKEGYNEEKSYCYFDGMLRKVNRVSTFKDYTVYSTPFDYVIQKGKHTSHAKSIKKGVLDLEFKIIAEKLKNEPIAPDTELTVKYYRTLTGACDLGVREWMQRNKLEFNVIEGETVEVNPIKAKDLLPILEETNAYGVEKFKSLVTF